MAVKVLWEHLLHTGHAQRAIRSYPVTAGSGYVEGGHEMGPGSRGSSWGSGAFEDLEAQAGSTAFPFPFPQSSQIQTGYSRSLTAGCYHTAECAFGTGMLQWALWVVVEPEYHHGSEDTPSRGGFHSRES